MKSRKTIIAAVLAVLMVVLAVSCDQGPVFPKAVVSADINQTTVLFNGQKYDPSMFTVSVRYNDDSTDTLKNIVKYDGSFVSNGAVLSAVAGIDWYGEPYSVTGYVTAYDVNRIEVTNGPETVDTTSTNSATIAPEELTVVAYYSVNGSEKSKVLAPTTDYTVSTASFDDLDTMNSEIETSVVVTLTFQPSISTSYDFAAHYTGDVDPISVATYEWDGKLAYSVADRTYYQRGLFGDGTDIISVYKVLEGKEADGTAVDGAYRFEAIEDAENLTITLSSSLSGSADVRFNNNAMEATATVSYKYVENNKYATTSEIAGSVQIGDADESGYLTGVLNTDATTITIALEYDYLLDMVIEPVADHVFYVNDSLDGSEFIVYPVFASGYGADTELRFNGNYTIAPAAVPADGKLVFTFTGSTNSHWSEFADGIESKEFTVEALDYPEAITAEFTADEIFTGQSYSLDMFSFTVTEWASGKTYAEGEAPVVEYAFAATSPDEAGSSRENVWINWSCNGKSSSDPMRVAVTPVADYPVNITALSTISGAVNTTYDDDDFEFNVTWASGLVYGEGGTTETSAPVIDYKYSCATTNPPTENADSVMTGGQGSYVVEITWSCNGHSSENPISVTINAQ